MDAAAKLHEGYHLDKRWHWLRGEMETTKQTSLERLARVLTEAGVQYAIIGGVAVQVHGHEPRTTLDIDVAVLDCARLPARALETAGFTRLGSHPHSENWRGPDGTPTQFTDDPALAGAVQTAAEHSIGDVRLRVITPVELLHAKLRAASDPARRKSKRLIDLADAQALVERWPALVDALDPAERAQLGAQ